MFTGDCYVESSDLVVLSLQNTFRYRSADGLLFIKTTQKTWNSRPSIHPSIQVFYITTHHPLRVGSGSETAVLFSK